MTDFGTEYGALTAELEAAGFDTTNLSSFSKVQPHEGFPNDAAATILIKRLPEMTNPRVVEIIVRRLTGEPAARGAGARSMLEVFTSAPDNDDQWLGAKWAIGNALATLADPELGEPIRVVILDPRHGTTRQMLCAALVKTKHPQAPLVLIQLIEDDDVAGHAIAALRSLSPKTSRPYLVQARPALEALLRRNSASPYARRQPGQALTRLR